MGNLAGQATGTLLSAGCGRLGCRTPVLGWWPGYPCPWPVLGRPVRVAGAAVCESPVLAHSGTPGLPWRLEVPRVDTVLAQVGLASPTFTDRSQIPFPVEV